MVKAAGEGEGKAQPGCRQRGGNIFLKGVIPF